MHHRKIVICEEINLLEKDTAQQICHTRTCPLDKGGTSSAFSARVFPVTREEV